MMVQPSLRKLVAIVMSARRPPTLAVLDDSAAGGVISVGDESFADTPCPDWLGFYDWLRTEAGEIVGLRLFLDDPADLDLERLTNLSGVALDVQIGAKRRDVTVFLGEHHHFHEPGSVDADFGGNRLFFGDKGSVAITFRAPNDTWWPTALERYGATPRLRD